MASLSAVKSRLTNLIVTQLRADTLVLQARHLAGLRNTHKVSTVRSLSYFTSRIQQLHLLQCQCCQRRHQSRIAHNVPQLDLEREEERETSPVNPTDVLQNLSPEDARKLKVIKLEFDVIEQMQGAVPEKMTDENWLNALQMDSKSKRVRYYGFLRKNELREKKERRKRELKQQERAEREETEEGREGESFSKNTIFMLVRDSTMKRAGNYRLAHAMQFGQPLVFDLNYEQYMRVQDCQNLVDQLLMVYSNNRNAPDPFHMVFTSVNPRGKVLPFLQKAHLTGNNFLGTMTDRSYLDMFPKEKLVYLTPHSGQTLKEVSGDDVYIVGGFIDKACHKPISLARAKEQGIRTAKFPLDHYLLWGMGSKSLTLDQVIKILLEQRRTKDWEEALKVVPRRKLHRND